MADTALHRTTSRKFKYLVNEAQVIYKTTAYYSQKITSSKSTYDFLINNVFNPDTIECYEEFYAIYVNRANNIKNILHVSKGDGSGTVIDIQRILKAGIDCLAAGVVIAHNHPSGNIRPSSHDIAASKDIEKALLPFKIVLLDSIIVTKSNYLSLKEEGIL